MLATRGEHRPTGEGWLHEIKWDGMRILWDAGRCTSRNENDVTRSYPELDDLADATGAHGRGLLLDGEIVAFDPDDGGRPSFGRLAGRMHVSRPSPHLVASVPVTFLVFDLLRLDGADLTRAPLSERRTALEGLGLGDVHWQVPPAYDDGEMLWAATDAQGLEGMVSKRLASRYDFGARSRHWLKFPHRRRTSWVIGGWRPESDSATRLGAVLVCEPTEAGWHYRGRVGSGIAGRVGPMLKQALAPLERADNPMIDVPDVDARGTHWVEPRLVVDVESLGFSHQGRLRQPAFRGLRADLEPADVRGQS